MLPYIPIHRPIHNVVEPILLTVLEGQPMQRVALPPSCQPWQKKLRKSGNDYAQSQPRVNQERLKKCSFENLNRFNQNRFRLKRFIPIEHDVIYQTRERVFHQDIQTPRSGLKKRGAAECFLTDFEEFGYLMKHFFEFLIWLLKPFIILGEIQSKSLQNVMLIKIRYPNHRHGSDFLCFLFNL